MCNGTRWNIALTNDNKQHKTWHGISWSSWHMYYTCCQQDVGSNTTQYRWWKQHTHVYDATALFFTTYLKAHSTVKCSVQHWSGGMGRQASRGSVASSEFHDCIFKSPTTPLSPDLLFSPTRRSESLGDRTNFTLKVESHWPMVIASFMIAFSKMSQTPPISTHAISWP